MHPITKNILKKHGLLNGVSDLIILLPNKVLFVELKKPKQKVFNHKTGRMNTKAGGKQSPEQKAFQEKVESLGFEYYLVDEFNDFVDIIKMHKTT